MAGNKEFEYFDQRIDDFTPETDTPTPPLRIILMGKGPFANDTLKGLLDAGHKVVSVVGPAILDGKEPDQVRKTADDRKIANFNFSSLKDKKTITKLRRKKPDLIIGANLTAIIEDNVPTIAPLGMMGFHPSLLPEYRGSSAIPWQIIDGKEEIGMTCYVIGRDEQLAPTEIQTERKLPKGSRVNDVNDIADKGPIISQVVVPLGEGEKTSSAAYSRKVAKQGVEFVINTTNKRAKAYHEGKIYLGQKQVKGEGSYQPPLLKEHVRIDWEASATEIDALIRGSQYNPGAWTQKKDEKEMITLYDSKIYEGPVKTAGKIENISGAEVVVAAGAGLVGVTSMRRGEMATPTSEIKGPPKEASEFVKERKMKKGSRFR